MVRFLLFFPSRRLRILTLFNYICVFILQDADSLVVSPQKPVDVHLTAFQSMEWIGTLPFKGHRCFDTDNYCPSSETNLDLFQFATSFYKGVKGVKQIVRFSPLLYPIGRWGLWKGFWRPSSYHRYMPSCKKPWELCPCVEWWWW